MTMNKSLIMGGTFHPKVVFDIETSHLFYTANQMTGFYMEGNTWRKWVNEIKVSFEFEWIQNKADFQDFAAVFCPTQLYFQTLYEIKYVVIVCKGCRRNLSSELLREQKQSAIGVLRIPSRHLLAQS